MLRNTFSKKKKKLRNTNQFFNTYIKWGKAKKTKPILASPSLQGGKNPCEVQQGEVVVKNYYPSYIICFPFLALNPT